jgi:hypothetical protein
MFRIALSDSSTATIIGAVVGAVIGIAGSLGTVTFQQWRSRKHARDYARRDLIAELEQNRQYQIYSKYVRLQDISYKRFKQAGFYSELNNDLQKQLRELYTVIHEKNDLISHYNRIVLLTLSQSDISRPLVGAETSRKAILMNLETSDTQINDLINKILPQLKALIG